MATHPGVYCLRSNQTDRGKPVAHLHHSHRRGAVFRSLKSELGLRPIYHHKPVRSEGHLFLTVIAYQLVQVIRKRLKQRGDPSSWTNPGRTAAGHGDLPAWGWADPARTQGHAGQTDQKAIYDALGSSRRGPPSDSPQSPVSTRL